MFKNSSGSIQETQKLMALKNYVYKKITNHNFEEYEIDVQVGIMELYYQLSKALIEIVAIAWKKDV